MTNPSSHDSFNSINCQIVSDSEFSQNLIKPPIVQYDNIDNSVIDGEKIEDNFSLSHNHMLSISVIIVSVIIFNYLYMYVMKN